MSNYPDNVSPNDPEAPWNQTADEPELLDDTTKIDVLLTAITAAKIKLMQGYPKQALCILEEAEREVSEN